MRNGAVLKGLLASSSNFRIPREPEERYFAGFALQKRILSALRLGDEHLVTPGSSCFRTPSATGSPQCPEEERDSLGGWSGQAGE